MKYLGIIIVLFIFNAGFAQNVTVKGKVFDGAFDKQPLAFASVKVKDLDISVETDIEGSYQLNLLRGRYTLIIDFIGYESIEIEDVIVSDSTVDLIPVLLEATKPGTYVLLASKDWQNIIDVPLEGIKKRNLYLDSFFLLYKLFS